MWKMYNCFSLYSVIIKTFSSQTISICNNFGCTKGLIFLWTHMYSEYFQRPESLLMYVACLPHPLVPATKWGSISSVMLLAPCERNNRQLSFSKEFPRATTEGILFTRWLAPVSAWESCEDAFMAVCAPRTRGRCC